MTTLGEANPGRPAGKARRPVPDLLRICLTLMIGAAGGWLFTIFNLPLAWMIGAMCATTAASLVGAPVFIPMSFRGFMIAVLGVMLGSAFSPELMDQFGRWLPSLGGLVAYAATITVLLFIYFRKIGGFDVVTAYFSASPGGLNEMILVGREMGGDDRTISLIHGSRVLFVVLTVPFAFTLLSGYDSAARPPLGAAFSDIGPSDLAVLAVCGVVGVLAARALRIPAAYITGPMALSVAAHLTGLTASRAPGDLIAIAQVVVGAGVGCRFAGVPLAQIMRTLALGAGATVVMLVGTVAFSLALAPVTKAPFVALVLSYAPGGLAEMSLIALALGVDAAFVSTHHIVRIIIIVILAPAIFRRLAPRLDA